MAGVTLTVNGNFVDLTDTGAAAAIDRLRAFGEDMRPAWESVGEYLLRRTELRFENETGPNGTPWVDVKPATRERKTHPKILTETQRLRGGFSYRSSAEELLFGTNIVYAAIHEFGGTVERARYSRLRDRAEVGPGKAEIPARPFVAFDTADGDEVVAIFLDEIRLAAKGE